MWGTILAPSLWPIQRALGGGWKNFMRIRVSIDVRNALKRRMKIRKGGGDWFWVNFHYQRLPTFCFICGILGHSDSTSELLFDNPDGFPKKAYGIWMWANANSHGAVLSGAKWLRDGRPTRSSCETESDRDDTRMETDRIALDQRPPLRGRIRQV